MARYAIEVGVHINRYIVVDADTQDEAFDNAEGLARQEALRSYNAGDVVLVEGYSVLGEVRP